MLRFDGHYATGPEPGDDWHAGVRMHGTHFHYVRFFGDATWLGCYRNEAFFFWEFTESISEDLYVDALNGKARQDSNGDPILQGGQWTQTNDRVTKILEPHWSGGQKWEFGFQIHPDRLIADTDEKTPWIFYPAD